MKDTFKMNYIDNEIKLSILNNEPLEDKLHVIMVISNPCEYKRRYKLANEFILRMNNENDVILYIVEMCYLKQEFMVTELGNSRHLQLRTDVPLWHKENMINLGVKQLLPDNWKCFAWIDADIEFESATWVKDTLKVLNGCRDIIQLFSHAVDMDSNEDAMNVFASFGYQYNKKREYTLDKGINKMSHPGFAWAMTRKAYIKMGELFEYGILGSGDHHIATAIVGITKVSIRKKINDDYINLLLELQDKLRNLRLGYIPNVIRHYYHGSKKNRRYTERWDILIKYDYSPLKHIKKDKMGVLVPTIDCPKELLDEIMNYFYQRNEDE